MAEKRKPRQPSFKIERPGNNEIKQNISEKMQIVRSQLMSTLQRPVTNYDIMENLLTTWTEENKERLSNIVKEKQWSGRKGKERKQQLSERVAGANNPSAKTYKIITPTNTFIILYSFKRDHFFYV